MTARARGRGIVLVGYRASGKSTVGRLLASRAGWPFLDSDAEVEARAGRSIADIFADGGEPTFRDLEEEAIEALCAQQAEAILATGGGAVVRPANRERLRRFGEVVYLRAPAPVLADRLRRAGGARPALTSEGLVAEVAAVLEAREPLYQEVADLVIDAASRSPSAIARAILASVGGKGGGP